MSTLKEEKSKVGKILRSLRLEKGVSLEKASKDTKITQKYLKAIEDEQFSAIPGEVVLKGFVRIYADYLKTDPRPLILEISKKPKRQEIKEEKGIDRTERTIDRSPVLRAVLVALAVLAAVVLAVILIRSVIFITIKQIDKNTVAQKTAAVKKYGDIKIEAKAVEKTWLLVLADGKLVFKDIVTQGWTGSWTAKDNLMIKIGNAAGIRLTSGGKAVMEPGTAGQVVTKEFFAK